MGETGEATLVVVLHALAEQHKHPERHGGGLIGKAVAVCEALGLDPDAEWRRPSTEDAS